MSPRRDRGARDLDGECRSVGAQCDHDETHDDSRPVAGREGGLGDRVHDRPGIEALLQVQGRGPPDLDVPRAVGRHVLDQLGRHALESRRVLEERDGKTVMHNYSAYQSVEARDAMIAGGMEDGMNDSFARLDDLLSRLRQPVA